MLLPRLAVFCHAHPNIELMLQVATPVRNMTSEEADIELRFGSGPFHDRECIALQADEVSPVCSQDYLHRHGPLHDFATNDALSRAQLLRTPLESWTTWFKARSIDLPEPAMGNQFSDLGLMLDAAAASLGWR